MKEVFENWNRFVKETLSALNEDLEKEVAETQEEKTRQIIKARSGGIL